MKNFLAALGLLFVAAFSAFAVTIAENGATRPVIVVDPSATPAEINAARQLASTLQEITRASFSIETNLISPSRAILVGPGAAAASAFPNAPLTQLGSEEWLIRTKGNRILLAGGPPRGTLYAVSRFLQDDCGVRWWTPWATETPRKQSLKVGPLDVRAKPAFEYRCAYWRCAADPVWS